MDFPPWRHDSLVVQSCKTKHPTRPEVSMSRSWHASCRPTLFDTSLLLLYVYCGQCQLASQFGIVYFVCRNLCHPLQRDVIALLLLSVFSFYIHQRHTESNYEMFRGRETGANDSRVNEKWESEEE